MKMNSFKGKKLLSFLRSGDYAHAGEEEAIQKVMSKISKNKNRLLLDVGCGRGGTANFIQANGFGQVTGFDIEEKSIKYAKEKYPNVDFYVCDVVNASKLLNKKFDIIYLFNSFYAFEDQFYALKSLHNVANKNAKLIIFDYIDLKNQNSSVVIKKDKAAITNPISLKIFSKIASDAGIEIIKFEDITLDYKRWYAELLSKIKKNRNYIIKHFGEDAFDTLNSTYTEIYTAIEKGKLGGGVIYARIL